MDATRPSLLRLTVTGLALGAAATGLVLVLLRPGPSATPPDDGTGPDPAVTAGASTGVTTGAAAGDGWAAWGVDASGAPLRWDACAPVRFVWRPDGAPPGAEADLRTALDVLADASGLDLRLIGATDAGPSVDRPLVVRTDGGWAWAPVLVAWDRPGGDGPPLGPHDRGVAEPVAVRAGERHALVTGQVVLNAARTDLRPGFEDRADTWGAVLLHELAHVLGLAHVDDPAQLMAAAPGRGAVVLGDGDRAGLAALGADAGCAAAPDPEPGIRVTPHEG